MEEERLRRLEFKRKRRLTLAIWLKTYKSTLKCVVCGEKDPVSLDFYHKNSKEKESSVEDMVSKGI